MAMPFLSVLDKGWPFAASVLGGAIAFGSLHSDVSDLKIRAATQQLDHDAIIRIEQSQADMKTTLADIKDTLKKPIDAR